MSQVIETQRLIIREYTIEDRTALHQLLSDPVTMSFWPEPFNREQTDSWINRSLHAYETYGFGRWGITLKENGVLIGDAGIMLSEMDGKREYDLGYIVFAPFWSKGYAFEAAQACLHFGMNRLGINRMCANMPHDHHASRRVAEKLGMTFERQFHNKRNRDILTDLYSVTVER